MVPCVGNCAAGCHFRPCSFASSPFDDFAEMKNSTRKNVCQHVVGPSPWLAPDHRRSRPCRIGKGQAKKPPGNPFQPGPHPSSNQGNRAAYLRKSTQGALHPKPEAPVSAHIPCRDKTIRSAALQRTGIASSRPSPPFSNPPDIPTLRKNCGAAFPSKCE